MSAHTCSTCWGYVGSIRGIEGEIRKLLRQVERYPAKADETRTRIAELRERLRTSRAVHAAHVAESA